MTLLERIAEEQRKRAEEEKARSAKPQVPTVTGEEKPSLVNRIDKVALDRLAKEKPYRTAEGQRTAGAGPVQDFFSTFNNELANGLGIPVEAANQVAEYAGHEFMQSGDAQAALRKGLIRAGMAADDAAADSYAGKLGQRAANALPYAFGLFGAASRMAASKGTSVLSSIVRDVGQTTLKNPGKALVAEAGAVVGGQAGADISGEGPYQPLGEMAGSMAGSLASEPVVAIAKRAVNVPLGPVKAVAGKLFPGPRVSKPPIRPPGDDPALARAYGQQQIEGDVIRVQTAMDKAIARVSDPNLSAQQAQINFQKRVLDVKDAARRLESRYWSRVPLRDEVSIDPAYQVAKTVLNDSREAPSSIPNDAIELIASYKNRNNRPGQITVQRLLDMRGVIRRMRVEEEAKLSPNAALIRNYNRLEEGLLGAIDQGLPNDISIKQAREASRQFNEIFRRGPIGDTLAKRGNQDFRIPPGQSVEKGVLGRYGGPEAVERIQAGRPQARRTVSNEAQQAVRQIFAEEAGSPEAALRWINKNEKIIKPFAEVHDELMQVRGELEQGLAETETISKSAMARFVKQDPEVAIRKVMTSADPAGEAQQLVKQMSGDPDALNGMRSGFVDDILKTTLGDGGDVDPGRLSAALQDPKVVRVLTEVLEPDQFARLRKLANIATGLSRGDEVTLRSAIAPAGRIAFRIFGAQMGRTIAHTMGGGGTVQTPGIVANSMAKLYDKAFRGVPPATLLRLAVIDPAWERTLLARAPANTRQARIALRRMRRLVGAGVGLSGLTQTEDIPAADNEDPYGTGNP